MANPKQYVITPSPDITSRGNVTDVTSESGAHAGTVFPRSDNEGAMIPFQETYGSFTENEIDYQIIRSGGIGSAEWIWKLRSEDNDSWRGVGDIRNQTHLCNPFRDLEGKRYIANLGMAAVVSKAHNRLILFRRSFASTNEGKTQIAYRSLTADNPVTDWQTYTFQPSSEFGDLDIKANMWFVAACELDDGTLRMIGSNYDEDRDLWDFHLFGSNDGGLNWFFLQRNLIGRWYNQFDRAVYPYEVRNIHNVKMAASGSWIRIVWIGPYDERFHTLISSDRGATWENPAPPPYKYMYQPWISQNAIDNANAPGSEDRFTEAGAMAAYVPWMTSAGTVATKGWYAPSMPQGSQADAVPDKRHIRNPALTNFFDLVPVGGSEGSFTLVFQARPNTQPSYLGGSNPLRCIYMASAVRESGWGVARIIASPNPTLHSDVVSMAMENNNQQRPFQQSVLTNCEIAAVATPSWVYIFVFTTPGQTGGARHGTIGWNHVCQADGQDRLFEPFNDRQGFGATWPSNRKAVAPGPWSITAQKAGFKGYRVPRIDPYGGAVQKLHVSDVNGHQFPGAVGQGKMFVPSNIVLEWDGSGIVMMNGIGHNGALDAYSNFQTKAAYGPTSTSGITFPTSAAAKPAQMCRYGITYQKNVTAYPSDFASGKTYLYGFGVDLTSTTDKYIKAYAAKYTEPASYGICVQKGKGRRAAFFDNAIEYAISEDGSSFTAYDSVQGRGHTAVTRWGGWDTQPLVEPNNFDVGQSLCAPFFADTWQAQYGIPHYNPIGTAWTGSNLQYPVRYNEDGGGGSVGALGGSAGPQSGATMMGFNIIGPATPETYHVDGNDLTLASGFIDTAQMPAFACDTGQFSYGTYNEPLMAAAASQWTVRANTKYNYYAGFTTTVGSHRSRTWPWTRVDRDMGNRTVDWESDRVTIRQNFENKRTGLTGTNRDNMPIAFSTWRSAYGSTEMANEYVGSRSTLYYPDTFNEAYGGSLWGNSQYLYLEQTKDNPAIRTKGYNQDIFADALVPSKFSTVDSMRARLEKGRPIPLGNGGVIEWVCSVPHKGLRGTDNNPNVPLKHVTTASGDNGSAGNWRLAAVSIRFLTETGGYGTGGELYYSELCVAIGQDQNSEKHQVVLVDQVNGDIVDTTISSSPVYLLSSIELPENAMGSVESPIFWEFRLALYATYEKTDRPQVRCKLLAREYGSSGKWLESEMTHYVASFAISPRINVTQHEYSTGSDYGGNRTGWTKYPMQWCQWGKLDEQVTDSAYNGKGLFGSGSGTTIADHEYVSYWKSFNVSHIGTGSNWKQADFNNPHSLSGMICSPIPVYVYTGIYARWGGGGAFMFDMFEGSIDHTYAVENIFKPSPATRWKSNTKDTSYRVQPETSITIRATNTGVSSDSENYRTYANWMAFYGTQTRKFLVEFSKDSEFVSNKTITYEANSLLTENADVVSMYDNHFELSDPNHLIKDGEWAGCYAGFLLGGFYRTGIIRDNWRSIDNRVTVALEANTGNLDLREGSLTGLGMNASYDVDIWSDRCAIDLYSDDQVVQIGNYDNAADFQDNGFNWMRIRFLATGKTTTVGSTSYNIKKGYYTIDRNHTIGNMVVGQGTEFEVPVKWEHTQTTKSNVKIRVAPSGQKLAYKQGPDRTTIALNFPGDIEQFRYKLTNMFRNNVDFDKKPIGLLMNAQAATSDAVKDRVLRASKRYNVLARLKGAVTDRNVAWRKDENGVWHTVGDMSLVFEEEV